MPTALDSTSEYIRSHPRVGEHIDLEFRWEPDVNGFERFQAHVGDETYWLTPQNKGCVVVPKRSPDGSLADNRLRCKIVQHITTCPLFSIFRVTTLSTLQ